MSYAKHFIFTFDALNDVEYSIEIWTDGYEGDVIRRALGSSPVLRQERSGVVFGTSLEFDAETIEDEEFSVLYTGSPTEHMVYLYATKNGSTVLMFQGFVTPELYSENHVAPPYDVHVTATDCLGELKLYEWEAQGRMALKDLLAAILAKTGLDLELEYFTTLYVTGGGDKADFWDDCHLDLDAYADGDNTYYDVLEAILNTFHANIRQMYSYSSNSSQGLRWQILRETDMSALMKSGYIRTNKDDTLTSTHTSRYFQPVGLADSYPMWVIDYLTREIEPAKYRQDILCPNQWISPLASTEGTNSCSYFFAPYANSYSGMKLRVVIAARGGSGTVATQFMKVQITLYMATSVPVTSTSDMDSYYVMDASSGRISTTPTYIYINVDPEGSGDESDSTEFEIPIQGANKAVAYHCYGIMVEAKSNDGSSVIVDSIGIYPYNDSQPEWQGILRLNNGARGKADDVELAVTGSDEIYDMRYGLHNALWFGGYAVNYVGSDAIDYMRALRWALRDYALSIAVPRIRLLGKVWQPFVCMPFGLKLADIYYAFEEWTLDLRNSELEFTALSLPAVTLDVESEVIRIVTEES